MTTRRQLLAGVASTATAALAGCTGDTRRPRVASIGDSEYVEDLQYEYPGGDLILRVNQPRRGEQIGAAVILDGDKEQKDASKLATGETQASFDMPPTVPGEYGLLVVNGGDMDCFGDHCALGGGNVLGRTTFTIELEARE